MSIIEDIIHFWFEETAPEQRFEKDPQFDALIRERFEPTYWEVMQGDTTSWRTTAAGRLAEILVLDQFARNMFREDAQAFAGDELALSLAKEAVAVGADQEVTKDQRVFFYMPYMHSESLAVHEQAVLLFTAYGSDLHLEYEQKHKAVIEAFGRYPYRNAVLGRESTPAEQAWLEAGGGF